MNDRNYPLLTKLFLELEIELHPTSMSFSVDTENISWCSEEFKKFRFFNSLKKIRIFLEMVRFNNIASNIDSNGTIEDWLKERKDFQNSLRRIMYIRCLHQFGLHRRNQSVDSQ